MIFRFMRRYIFILLFPIVRSLLNYGATGALSRLVIMEIVLAILIIVMSVLRWLFFSVTFREDCIVVDSGIFVRRHAVMPVEKVSVSGIVSGPMLFLFSAVSVRIDTDSGFGEKADFEIYFSRKNAEAFSTLMRFDDSGIVRYRSKIMLALVMALANASALTGLIILAPAVKRSGEILGNEINDRLLETLTLANALLGKIVPPAATMIAVIFIAGFGVSFLLSIIKYVPFKMVDTGEKIILKHGLISRYTVVINRGSINAVVINIPPVMRLFRFCWVGVSAAGYGKKRGESEVAIPAINLRQATDFQLGMFGVLAKDRFDLTCPKRTRRRIVQMPALLLALTVCVEVFLMLLFELFSGMIALVMTFLQIVIVYYISVRLDYQKNGGVSIYDGIVMRSYKRLTVKKMRVKKDKTCMIKVSQGPFERRYGVARVAVTVRSERPMTLKATNLDQNKTNELINRYFKT